MEVDVHVGLEREQISHSKNARVHGSAVLDFEGTKD